jgi:hypothetical protein
MLCWLLRRGIQLTYNSKPCIKPCSMHQVRTLCRPVALTHLLTLIQSGTAVSVLLPVLLLAARCLGSCKLVPLASSNARCGISTSCFGSVPSSLLLPFNLITARLSALLRLQGNVPSNLETYSSKQACST